MQLLKAANPDADVDDRQLEALKRKMYQGFIEHIDGIDNGVEAFDGGTRNYRVPSTLSNRVKDLNPRWNEPSDSESTNARFAAAVALTGQEFASAVEKEASSWWPARAMVAAALDAATDIHPSGQIIVLSHFCPWQEHLFELEGERAAAGDKAVVGRAKYVLFQDVKGTWRIQAVPVEEGAFANRRGLPEAWRGLRGEDLSTKAGITGCVFVHAGGFIGGCASYEGVLAMAIKSLE